jgi:hypothetical protein
MVVATHRLFAITLLVATSCNDAKPEDERKPAPMPIVVDAAATPPPDAAPAAPPTPRAKRGLIVFQKYKPVAGGGIEGEGTVHVIDPEGTAPVPLVTADTKDVLVGSQLIAGRDSATNQFWVVDLRAPTVIPKPVGLVEVLTPDNRIVWRCEGGGASRAFGICVADASGANPKEIYREPRPTDPPKQVGVILGASNDVVIAGYAFNDQPPFAVAISDGKRTERPALAKPGKSPPDIEVSPSGRKAASCTSGKHNQTRAVVVSTSGNDKPKTFELGKQANCECRLSHDDRKLACVLKSLIVIDVATGKKTTLAKGIPLADFAFAPDGTEIVHIAPPPDGEPRVLRATTIDGGRTRDILSVGTDYIKLHGWTVP